MSPWPPLSGLLSRFHGIYSKSVEDQVFGVHQDNKLSNRRQCGILDILDQAGSILNPKSVQSIYNLHYTSTPIL